MAGQGNFGLVPAALTCDKHRNRAQEISACRAELAKRTDLQTMKLVWEALIFAKDDATLGKQRITTAQKLSAAIAALNGTHHE